MGACLRGRSTWLQILIVLGLNLIPLLSWGQFTFEGQYGGLGDEFGFSGMQTSDGGYIIVGSTTSSGAGSSDVYILEIDSMGLVVRDTTYGGTSDDQGFCIQETEEGGYIVAGYTSSFGLGPSDIYLIKTDSAGRALWEKTYGGSNSERGMCVQQTADQGYIIVGYTTSFSGSGNVYIVKTDSQGGLSWSRVYGGALWDEAAWVEPTRDGGYVLAGHTYSLGAGEADVYLMKTDSLGDTVWTKTYGGSAADLGYCVQQTADGGYIVAGVTSSFDFGNLSQVYLIRTDSLGTLIWQKTYGGTYYDEGRSMRITDDGGYIIVGTYSPGIAERDLYLVKADSLGSRQWDMGYWSRSPEYGLSVRLARDFGYVAVGYIHWSSTGWDIYLVRTDEHGGTGTGETYGVSAACHRASRLLQNSPNPFAHSTAISYSLPTATQVTLTIYDITGRMIETLVNETQQPAIHQVRWDRRANSSGVYFYTLKAGEFVETRKMVVVE